MARPRPLVLTILDGWGHREALENNAIAAANTPCWNALMRDYPHGLLNASENDVGLPAGLEIEFERAVYLADYEIRLSAPSPALPIPGFVGTVRLASLPKTPDDVVRAVHCLADFAFYCGTGRKTGMGMGLTRRVPVPAPPAGTTGDGSG